MGALIPFADFLLATTLFVVYMVIWKDKTPTLDLEIFIESIKAGLTAASILLPGIILIFAKLPASKVIPPTTIYIALFWVGVSLVAGIWNLFTLPTIVGNKDMESEERVTIERKYQLFIALGQFVALGLAGVRIFIGVVV